ncbi:MAG: ribonuclease E inhibitor RraB [bacterium]
MIEFEAIKDMFDQIRKETEWDIDGPMLWGYFFTDKSEEKLEKAAYELNEMGYFFVDLYEPDLEEGEEKYFFLHVEKEEAHTPDSLFKRNLELNEFAQKLGIDSYDGMDVGNIGDVEEEE